MHDDVRNGVWHNVYSNAASNLDECSGSTLHYIKSILPKGCSASSPELPDGFCSPQR
jgi:hypothetical protein